MSLSAPLSGTCPPVCLSARHGQSVCLLTGVDLQAAGGAGEQRAGAVVTRVRVGGRRLGVACPGAEAHLGDQRMGTAAAAGYAVVVGGTGTVGRVGGVLLELNETGKDVIEYCWVYRVEFRP